jgi:hypothetical protein
MEANVTQRAGKTRKREWNEATGADGCTHTEAAQPSAFTVNSCVTNPNLVANFVAVPNN